MSETDPVAEARAAVRREIAAYVRDRRFGTQEMQGRQAKRLDDALDRLEAEVWLAALNAVEEIADMQRTDGLVAIADDWWEKLYTEAEAARDAAKQRQEAMRS